MNCEIKERVNSQHLDNHNKSDFMIPWNGDVMVWWTIQESFVAPILRKKEKCIYFLSFWFSLLLFSLICYTAKQHLSCTFNRMCIQFKIYTTK
jgi:hypothetical protein